MKKNIEELRKKLNLYKSIIIGLVAVCICLICLIVYGLDFIVASYNRLTDYQKGYLEGFTIAFVVCFAIMILKLGYEW